MQKPDFLILDEQFKLLKLKKKVVETELNMPLNSLSSMLSGKRNIPDKWLILLKKYIESKGGSFELNNDRGNPLTNAARGRDASGVNEDENKAKRESKSWKDKLSDNASKEREKQNLSPFLLSRQSKKNGQ